MSQCLRPSPIHSNMQCIPQVICGGGRPEWVIYTKSAVEKAVSGKRKGAVKIILCLFGKSVCGGSAWYCGGPSQINMCRKPCCIIQGMVSLWKCTHSALIFYIIFPLCCANTALLGHLLQAAAGQLCGEHWDINHDDARSLVICLITQTSCHL